MFTMAIDKKGQIMDEKGAKMYQEAVAHVAAQRDKALELADELVKDVHHWQDLCDQEHAAFVQAAEERDTYIRECHSKSEKLRQVYHELHMEERVSDVLRQQLKDDHDKMQEAVDHAEDILDELCEMVAEDCSMDDIAAVLMQYRAAVPRDNYRAKYNSCIELLQDALNADDDQVMYDAVRAVLAVEDECNCDPWADYKWKVMVVDNQGDDPVFTGWFKDYDMARESVDLMINRGCYEAWVEELQ